MINNILSYFRKEKSTLLTLSAASLLLLSSAVLPLPNPLLLLQPVQAQTPMTFKTPQPVTSGSLVLTLDAQGTLTRNFSGYQPMNGTFQLNSTSDGSIKNSGDIERGRLSNNSEGVVSIVLVASTSVIEIYCSTPDHNFITYEGLQFQGAVECNTGGDTTAQPPFSSSQGGGNTTTTHTAQPPSSLATSSQGTDRGSSSSSIGGSRNSTDSDRDGIPDSSDRCTHNSNSRCFKEDTTTTTTQQPPSSSNRTGNQTR